MKNFLSTALLLAQLAAGQGAPSARSSSSNLARSKGPGFQHQPIKQAPQAAVQQGLLASSSAVESLLTGQQNTPYYYTTNWAGAALLSADLASTPILTSAAATFTAPIPTDYSYHSRPGRLDLAGIDVIAASSFADEVEYVYTAWYECYPVNAVDFSPEALAIKGGDVIVATVYATSSSAGVAVIENTSTGQRATATDTAPDATSTLTGQSAEWIVEDYQSSGETVSFLDFGSVTFTGVTAGAAAGNLTFTVEVRTMRRRWRWWIW
ncbi:concanavalin A-like lectin/glucanase [Aspergillus japonicus CBS 114.51]|uniref:Concanavalin A-like lectin/glucanase n=1 Tax=Aspergillus japonicus CBS 114.51 TaxID=1448312 RepID=A0A8T8XGG6_ASPJA|nr:concanavalin A-like lectin/glucanase [Aspergillus japonicus CBS 114.51]RAH87366.1 concanavalin A-like lectin/glucanase [Aspergillus japonicus CBS 114.51]